MYRNLHQITLLNSLLQFIPHLPGQLCTEPALEYMRGEGRLEDARTQDLSTEFGGGWIKKLRYVGSIVN